MLHSKSLHMTRSYHEMYPIVCIYWKPSAKVVNNFKTISNLVVFTIQRLDWLKLLLCGNPCWLYLERYIYIYIWLLYVLYTFYMQTHIFFLITRPFQCQESFRLDKRLLLKTSDCHLSGRKLPGLVLNGSFCFTRDGA